MESRIPISKKPTGSRIPCLPSSIQPPSSISTKKSFEMPKTGLKRPRPFDLQSNLQTTANRIKRSTPFSLMKTRKDHLEPTDSFIQPLTKLDFSDPFQTPMSIKNVQPKASISKIPTFSSISNLGDFPRDETFPETNNTTITKQLETKSTSPIADWKTITKDSEMISLKVKINVLQKEIDELQCKNSKLKIENEVNENRLRTENEQFKNKNKELQTEIETMKKNEEKLKYEFEEFQKLYLEQTNMLEKQAVDNEKNLTQIRNELIDAKLENTKIRSKFSMEALNFKHRIKTLESELEELRNENQIHRSTVHDFEQKQKEIESLKNELNKNNSTIENLKNDLKSYQEGSKLESIFKGELSQLKSIKEENINLKRKLDLLSQVHDENVVLKEKLIGNKNQIELLNEQLKQKNVDMHELQTNRDKLAKWIQIVGLDSPDLVADKIRQLTENVSMLTVENDILKSEIKTLKDKILNDENSAKSLTLELGLAKDKIKLNETLLENANKKYSFLSKERDYYQKMANSLEKDKKEDEVTNKRIDELESIVNDYKTIISKLESDLNKTREQLDANQSQAKENEELKNEIKRIKELNPHICTNVSLMEVSTLQTNEKQYRIIHYNNNPLAIETKNRIEELSKLKEENNRLKCLVEILERGDANNADITKQIDEAIHYRFEVEKLKTTLNKADKQFKNLKEMFKKNCDLFRMACMELTGFQIDNIGKNKYRLRHKYAFKDEFIVEVEGRNIKLYEDVTTEKLKDKIKFYLYEHASYPAFFASYTLDLFKNQTLQ